MKIIRIFRSILSLSSMFFINIKSFMGMSNILPFDEGKYTIDGFVIGDFYKIIHLYKNISKDTGFNIFNLIILVLFRNKSCMVVKEGKGTIVGFDIFYFNPRDIEDHTIHEGYIGVSGSYQNLGVATLLRRVAKRHFENAGLSGISSRIAADNHASLRSALRAGFVVKETFAKPDSEGRHHYLQLMFDGERRE